jgi:hypothetical protein
MPVLPNASQQCRLTVRSTALLYKKQDAPIHFQVLFHQCSQMGMCCHSAFSTVNAHLVVRQAQIFRLGQLLEGDCGVANARRGRRPRLRFARGQRGLALTSDQLGRTRKLKIDGPLEQLPKHSPIPFYLGAASLRQSANASRADVSNPIGKETLP